MAGEKLQKAENKKIEKIGFLEKVKNVFSKKNPRVEDEKKESTAQSNNVKENGTNKQIVEVNATATTIEQGESVAKEFLQKILNNLERNRGEMEEIIFSDDFKKAIREEAAYTAAEREMIEPEKVKFFVEAGAPYQDPEKQQEVVEKRRRLIAKLNGSKEGIKNIAEYYELDIILKTLATKDEWLKKFYDEAVAYSVETSRLKGNKEPGEILGQIFSYLTTTPTLTNRQIKKYQNDCLIPREKIKEFIKNDIMSSVGNVDEKIKSLINIIVDSRDDKRREEAVEKSLYYILGVLTSDNVEKKNSLIERMMETIEVTNSKANKITITRDELVEDFKLYKLLTSVEEKLKEAIEKNKEGDIKASLDIFNEAFNKWGGINTGKRAKRATGVYSTYFNTYLKSNPNFQQMQTEIDDKFSLILSQIGAEQPTTNQCTRQFRNQYAQQLEELINKINNLITTLYPWEAIIRTTKNSLNRIVDERALNTWDFLKARQEIRAPPIDISKLKGDVEEKKKSFTDRVIEKVQKFGYWLWYGIPVLKATIKGAFWIAYLGTGIKAIKENWYHKYPHTMYPFLSRRTGVIINAILKRIVAAAIFLYIGAGVLPNTWVEETAIKLHLAEPYQKVNRKIKQENGIKKVVWVDQNGKERKMNEDDIKEYYNVKNEGNIKYLLSNEGSMVLVYLERLSDYNNKDQRYLINPQKVDDFVKYIREKDWGEKDYILIKNKIIPPKIVSPNKVLEIDKMENFRDIKYKDLNDDLKKQLDLRTKEQNRRELEFLMNDFIIPNNVASYINKYNLTSEEAKEMREIISTNPILGSMFHKGRSNFYIINPKGLLAQIKEDKKSNKPIPTTEDEIKEKYSPYLEKSINIEKELGINPFVLSNENLAFIIENKDKFKQGGDYRKIVDQIKINYTINPNMQNDFIDYLQKFVSTSIINNDTMNTFIEFLDTEKVITSKEPQQTSKEAPIVEKMHDVSRQQIQPQQPTKATGRAPLIRPNNKQTTNKPAELKSSAQPQKPSSKPANDEPSF